MGFDWDILLDDVSIKDQIARFQVRDSVGGYARELTLTTADPSFYDQFSYSVLPKLRLEVKIKETDTWISLGKFYVEQPGITTGVSETGIKELWGRSETAKGGPPFAVKVSKIWNADTTVSAIVAEMADLCDLSVNFEMTDYSIFAGSYSANGVYPINVIIALAEYAGGYVGCTADGNLVVTSNMFHPTVANHTLIDINISDLDENVEYPEFGNRIKISADRSDPALIVRLEASDCLPADGSSKSKLYAFVSDNDGPVEDGVVVTWTAEDGVVVEEETTVTGRVLMSNKVHNADNYYTVLVDYPVSEVIGIWAYSDRRHLNNFWNDSLSGCTFEDNEITVHNPFLYCDQTLIITYIASGCATNTVTAGTVPEDVTVTADVNGSQGTIDIKMDNTCACGSSLDAVKSTDTDICFGNSTPILIWAEINGGPATGMIVTLTLTGCGALSSTKKILGLVPVGNEIGYVINEIAGTSQVEMSVFPAESTTPKVYLKTDTSKTNDLYQSHTEKIIDLSEQLDTGSEVWIDYVAVGAAAVSWLSDDVTEECDAEILIKIADGTETGLSKTLSISATDCSVDSNQDPITSDYSSYDDPDDFDNDGTDGGDTDCVKNCKKTYEDGASRSSCIEDCQNNDSGGVYLTDCDISMLNIWANIENATAETKDNVRFGIPTENDCPDQEADYPCSCSEICGREIANKGNTFEHNQTISEQAKEYGEIGSPAYNEAYANTRAANLAECEQKCEDTRVAQCESDCDIFGPAVLTPGESAEYVCSDGTTALVTMPEGACGTQTFTVGCCTFDVRSSVGQWVEVDSESSPFSESWSGGWCGRLGAGYDCPYTLEETRYKYVGYNAPYQGDCPGPNILDPRPGTCNADVEGWYKLTETTYEWQC